MFVWQIIVALIQGFVEWLPISSEGQAVLFLYNIGAVPPAELITLVIWLHLGTALAVVARYPRTIYEVLTLKDRVLLKQLLIATIATAITAVPLYFLLIDSITALAGEVLNVLVGALLLITAAILYLPTRAAAKSDVEQRETDSRVSALTGLVQGFSVLPGLSRSGVTVSALLMQRVENERALRFSFLMSVPAVAGILVLDILTGAAIPPSIGITDLILMEAIVFVSGLISMEFLLRLARRVSFWKLCLVIGLIAIVVGLPALL
jgi:undecaprenyl-diphosphatase